MSLYVHRFDACVVMQINILNLNIYLKKKNFFPAI